MKVALVYDRVNKWGGAEKVLLSLNEIFPDAPLYAAVYDSKKASWAKVFPQLIPSFLQKIPFMQDKHEFLGAFTPIAFEQFNFDEFDLVLSVTSEAAKGIITKPNTKHICYCLTPTRYLWGHYGSYFNGFIFKSITKPIVNYLRTWDKVSAYRPDVMISISTEVQNRIYKYYKRQSKIIFPPVDVDRYGGGNAKSHPESNKLMKLFSDDKGYFLVVSRLVSYKRIDLAIKAFNQLGKRLVVVGQGSEEYKLRMLAKKNIIFMNNVNDEELVGMYKNAKALIFPGEEDFGIVMVESLASGTPVIAYKKGGALDIVENGKTGILFNAQNVDSLIESVGRFKNMQFNTDYLMKSVTKFSKERFKKEVLELIGS